MKTIPPIRISFNEACRILDLSRQGLYELISRDPELAACVIKDGNSRQSNVYLLYAELQVWAKNKATQSQGAQS
ncbi:transcriptional regulator [Acinetobacter bereziniae]|uniref:transcriptional regulator n=1 Tax=Acinetobacter bereziniae TaxID=106648 RepID=UPI00124F9E55|nr:transcriptional regulator [Acinetobacter bereziniae]